MAELRIGKVSSIDYDHGMIRVVYTDRDKAVTKPLPVLTFNDEYKMPKVGQYVLVGHLSNGTEAAYVMGTFWNAAHPLNKFVIGLAALGQIGEGRECIEKSLHTRPERPI